jgi:hypothetical protein
LGRFPILNSDVLGVLHRESSAHIALSIPRAIAFPWASTQPLLVLLARLKPGLLALKKYAQSVWAQKSADPLGAALGALLAAFRPQTGA